MSIHPDSSQRGALLEPTLAPGAQVAQLYSKRALFFTAFFGGPLALTILLWRNLQALGRQRQDGWLVVLGIFVGVALAVGIGALLAAYISPDAPFMELARLPEYRYLRWTRRAAAMLLAGGVILYHRRFFGAMEMSGVEPRPAWRDGILAILIGGTVGQLLLTRVTHFLFFQTAG